jgi:hypothetical protein
MDWTIDSEHRSVHHLITRAPALARKFDMDLHVTEDGGIDFDAVEGNCFSDAERLLVRAARDLWNGSGSASLGGLLTTLDEANYEALVEAMRIRREWTTR